MSYIVNIRTGPGPVLSLFGLKDRRTGPSKKARTVDTLLSGINASSLREIEVRGILVLCFLPTTKIPIGDVLQNINIVKQDQGKSKQNSLATA